MSWQLFIFISIFFTALSTILQKVLLRTDKSDPIAYSIFFQLITGFLIGIFGLLLNEMLFPNIRSLFMNLIFMAFLYGFGNIFVFKALKLTEASLFTIIFSSRALFTILASSLLLSEGLILKQIFGASLIIAGVLLVTYKSIKFSFSKGELYSALAAVSFGLAVTNDRYLLSSFNVYPYVFIAFIIPAVFIGIIYPKNLANMKIFMERKILFKMILLCIVYALAAITFFSALKLSNNSSQIAGIYQVVTVVTVILSIIFLKEKEKLYKKILGAVLSFIGLLLLR